MRVEKEMRPRAGKHEGRICISNQIITQEQEEADRMSAKISIGCCISIAYLLFYCFACFFRDMGWF